jgi:SAM-dependent methyltransferase
MHLERGAIRAILAEAARVLRPGGVLIADIVSKTRRNMTGKRSNVQHAWHAATALTKHEFETIGRDAGLERAHITGLLFLPVHRLPERSRSQFTRIDGWLADRVPSLSSYLVACFAKP